MNYFVLAVAILAVFLILKGVRIVPQAENCLLRDSGNTQKH